MQEVCRLGRESGGWQRSGGEVLLLGRPLEIFLGGCSCIEGGRIFLEVAGHSFGLEVKIERIPES